MNLRQADFDSIEAKIQADLETLDNLVPKEDGQATEHAKDMKYLRERQQCLAFVSSCFLFFVAKYRIIQELSFFPGCPFGRAKDWESLRGGVDAKALFLG